MSATPKQLGKYELQERLGQGGMAEVWKAFDPQLKRYVAIKFMHTNLRSDPDFVKRFVREGQAIASLRHPNIVQVYDFEIAPEDEDGPMAYMIMDYIEGQTLAKYIRETSFAGKFPSNAEIVHLFTSICLAVDYAHQNHIIHRDIKPANILLDARNKQRNPMGEPILTDFGIVKMLGAATLTSTGMSLGTPLYISPEQVQGQPGNEKSDIYALGVMLYEICAGKPAFEGDSAYGIMVQRLHTVPMPVSQVNPNMPPELDDVIFRCLAKDPQARFASASMLAIALANALKVPVLEQISLSGIAADPADLPTFFSPLDRASNPGLMPNTLSNASYAPNTPSNQGANRPSNQGVVADRTSNPGYAANNPSSQGSASGRPSNPGDVSGDAAFIDAMQNKLQTVYSNTPTSQAVVPATLLHRDHDIPVEGRVIVTPEDRFVATPPRPPKRPGRKGLMIAVVVIALLALIGSGTYIFLSARGIGTAGTNIVGTASFFSSRQLNSQGMPGINDGVQVHLQNLSNPAAGNNYYVWLRNDKVETESVYLGALKINQGTATLTYTDSQHRDLLAGMDNFLVTEESASPVPNQPTLQQANWRYSASLPSTPSKRDNFSYLDHLRHLLSTEPDLQKLGLNGGVDYWFLNNIQEMQKQAMEVKDHASVSFVRQQVTNILYYLDGKCAAQDLSGAPVQTGPENAGIAHDTQVSLLDCPQLQTPPAYITHIGLHLNGLAQAPGVTSTETKRAIEINNDLNIMKSWLVQMRTDAKQLAMMDDTQLGQAQQLRGDLATYADFVVGGRVDPATQALQPSAQQICDNIELLASFEVAPYKAA